MQYNIYYFILYLSQNNSKKDKEKHKKKYNLTL